MDLHIYRNSQDRRHDLKAAVREHGVVLAIHALTLDELVLKLTLDVAAAAASQRVVLMNRALRQAEAVAIPNIVRNALAPLRG